MSPTAQPVSSIELVQPEIDSTIQQAEDSLSSFVENRDSGEALQNCIDCLNQLRGIYILVEVQGCVLLCQQAVALANEVPVGASDDKNDLLSSLSNAIFVLRRYTEYFGADKKDHPELLLPVINELRVASSEKPYPESHFFDLDSLNGFDPAPLVGASADKRLENFEHHARRFRHMYQVGLLDLLKDRNTAIALKLISRAAQGSARLCAGEPLSHLWALTALLADAIQSQGMELSETRKRVLMKLERYLREMVMVGAVVAGKAAPDSLTKELLYLLALSGDRSESVAEVLRGYDVQPLGIDEAQLRSEAKRLFGPGVDVLRSLSKAINEEMSFLKEKLDVFERGAEPNPEDIEYIAEGLKRMNGTLQMLDLPKTAALSEEIHTQVDQWLQSRKLVPESELLVVANGILTIESSIKHFEERGTEADISNEALLLDSQSNSYLSEARIVVIDEAQNGMALTKRSVSAYVESQGDKLHLANIAAVMDTISGGMIMIDQPRVASIVRASARCIQHELLERAEMPDSTLLETLADALSSLEYFIESMHYKDSQNEQLLKLSEESLESIGYPADS
jgi:hypothetical protein